MSALPKLNSLQVQNLAKEDTNYLNAYNICLQYEEESAAVASKLRHVRILGFLLLNAPDQGARSEVTNCILSCKDSSILVNLGAFLESYLILPFKTYRGRTPKPSDHPSRPSFEDTKDEMKVDITEVPKNHKDAKDRALIRDNWRCAVTGIVHGDAPEDIMSQLDPQTTTVSYTECAHIIPEATFFGVNPKSEENSKFDYSASILAVLKRFRYDITSFNGEKVHSLPNVVTMEKNVHEAFDRLKLYFEATPQKDRYEVKCVSRFKPHPQMRDFITFSTKDPEHLPTPASELLALHAACCKVAHLSGAAEHIDRVYRDADEIGVLSGDGTSGDMLGYALLSLSNSTVSVRG